MTPVDRKAFALAMSRLFALYHDELTDAVLDAWWGVLAAYPLAEVLEAMTAHAADPKAGMYRPLPAHLIGHLTETLPARRRERARLRAARLAEAIDPHDRAIRQLENDVALGLRDRADAATRIRLERAAIETLTRAHLAALERGETPPALSHDDA